MSTTQPKFRYVWFDEWDTPIGTNSLEDAKKANDDNVVLDTVAGKTLDGGDVLEYADDVDEDDVKPEDEDAEEDSE